MQGAVKPKLFEEPPSVLREVQHLLEAESFQLPEFDLADDISGLAKMLSVKSYLNKGLVPSVIDAFPAQKEIYSRYLSELEEEIKYQASFLGRVSAALKAGYSPFTVNKTWFCGLLEPEQDTIIQDGHEEIIIGKISNDTSKVATISSKKYPLFNQVFPEIVWEKYQTAKNLGIFDAILVHSPVPGHFDYIRADVRVVDVKIIKFCPILIGYVRSGKPSQIEFIKGNNQFSFVSGEEKVIPFLIAQWDLGKDLGAGQS